ncbi:MAG: hypothetical protein AAGB04_26260 [Pseudomonadota bacterium]
MPKCKNCPNSSWIIEFDRLCKEFDNARQSYDDAIRLRDVKAEQTTFAMILAAATKLNELLPASDEDIDALLM